MSFLSTLSRQRQRVIFGSLFGVSLFISGLWGFSLFAESGTNMFGIDPASFPPELTSAPNGVDSKYGKLHETLSGMTQSSCISGTNSGILIGYSGGTAQCWTYQQIAEMLRGVGGSFGGGGFNNCNVDETKPQYALKGFTSTGAIICGDIYEN